jgi:hypothetical protein
MTYYEGISLVRESIVEKDAYGGCEGVDDGSAPSVTVVQEGLTNRRQVVMAKGVCSVQ